MRTTKTILVAALLAGLSATAQAGSFGKPCTTEPEDKWMTLGAIEKIVNDHGYTVAKSKLKNGCVELYARDSQDNRIEFFIDPATGNPVGVDWKNPTR